MIQTTYTFPSPPASGSGDDDPECTALGMTAPTAADWPVVCGPGGTGNVVDDDAGGIVVSAGTPSALDTLRGVGSAGGLGTLVVRDRPIYLAQGSAMPRWGLGVYRGAYTYGLVHRPDFSGIEAENAGWGGETNTSSRYWPQGSIWGVRYDATDGLFYRWWTGTEWKEVTSGQTAAQIATWLGGAPTGMAILINPSGLADFRLRISRIGRT